MTLDLHELYSDLIRDHSRKPRAMRALDDPTHAATGYNPLCGDRIVLQLRLSRGVPNGEGEAIDDAAFTGAACAICTASASMLCESVRGRSVEDARERATHFIHAITSDDAAASDEALIRLGDTAALLGVKRFPMRVKCATLPWHTMRAALEEIAGDHGTISTE